MRFQSPCKWYPARFLPGSADLRVVQERLGHSNIQTPQVYTHVNRTRLNEVMAKFHPRLEGRLIHCHHMMIVVHREAVSG